MYYFGDALRDIKGIKGQEDGHLDFNTLPAFAKKERRINIYRKEIVIIKGVGEDAGSEAVEIKTKTGEVTEPVRDLGAMVSILTVAVQQLLLRIEKLESN